MSRSRLSILAVFVFLAIQATEAFAFDQADVLQLLAAARKSPPLALQSSAASALASPESIIVDQTARLAKEDEAAFKLLSTCEGRFGALRRTLGKR